MKKIVLAAAVASITAASSVSAATIYEGNGFKYEVKGDIQVQLRQKIGDNKDADLEFDDLELKNRVTYVLNEDMTAFGQLDYSFDKEANNASSDTADGGKLEEAYLGLDFGSFAVRFGKQSYSSDEFGTEQSYETIVKGDVFDLNDDAGDDVIRVDAELGNFSVSVSTDLTAEGNSKSDGNESVDLFVATSVGNVDLHAAYQSYQSASSSSINTWGVGAKFDAGFAKFGADYSSMEDTADVYNLSASFPVAATTSMAVGIQSMDTEGADEVTGWYANVTYKFPNQKNVSLFAEIADTDESNSDMGYLAGMRLKF